MMSHLPMLPILIPLLGGLMMLLPPYVGADNYARRRIASLALILLQIGCAIWLLLTVSRDGAMLYALGDWQPPFGIILYADGLAAMLVLLTSVLGLGITLYSCSGTDREGKYFHPLIQFQLLGIYGAFLTNDLFNLFVFFEVLLIASYTLLIHGGGKHRTAANVHYVILNLIGSSLFLIALGTLYGTTGTLNMADMSLRIAALSESQAVIAQTGGALLLIVFGLKSAMLPLHFWLPRTYEAATAPVAALFAIMTKVGVYCIYRVFTVVFGSEAGQLADMALPWIWPLAILSIAAGTLGVLASPNLRTLTGNLVIVSVGTLLVAFALRTPEATAAGLYYLIHSTLISAALFLIADMVGLQRGKAFDRFVLARRVQHQSLLGIMFFVAALSIAGLPPFSGFLGKLVILQSVTEAGDKVLIWSAILISSLAGIVALSRAGTTLFWRHPVSKDTSDTETISSWKVTGTTLLLSTSILLVIFGGHVLEYTNQAAIQLHDVQLLLDVMNLGGTAP
ncbi:monovalent cation/H+ antiporter subunit D [Alteromonas oceanisediminis]|uniref:monovalent cation/H+ antiporter subunit D n=1 Tax=Alteromonas oceanisediminis TaxID=2836180 RepID=UPI001BD967F1|nr:monovalent cation/H+ antiporter subunit D [Alteromonas oceanisediminis]MBT0586015.1 monovalent cation/H+ antiporter subunit D [Alteromonas oceanisediminis]